MCGADEAYCTPMMALPSLMSTATFRSYIGATPFWPCSDPSVPGDISLLEPGSSTGVSLAWVFTVAITGVVPS